MAVAGGVNPVSFVTGGTPNPYPGLLPADVSLLSPGTNYYRLVDAFQALDLSLPLTTAQQDILALQSASSTQSSQIGTLQGQVATLEGEVATLQGQVSTLQGQVATLQSQVTTLQGQIVALENEDAYLQGQITTINNRLAAAAIP